jgi:hypothetical protein
VIASSRDCREAGPETGGSIFIAHGNLSNRNPFCLHRAHSHGAPATTARATHERLDLSHRFDRGDHGDPFVLRPALTAPTESQDP